MAVDSKQPVMVVGQKYSWESSQQSSMGHSGLKAFDAVSTSLGWHLPLAFIRPSGTFHQQQDPGLQVQLWLAGGFAFCAFSLAYAIHRCLGQSAS